MKKKLIVWIMAMAASLSLAVPVAAAPSRGTGRTVNRGTVRAVNYVDANGDGICDNFTDADNNGICDHCTGNGGRGRWFVDNDGDGICDNFTGGRNGGGRRCGQCRGRNRF